MGDVELLTNNETVAFYLRITIEIQEKAQTISTLSNSPAKIIDEINLIIEKYCITNFDEQKSEKHGTLTTIYRKRTTLRRDDNWLSYQCYYYEYTNDFGEGYRLYDTRKISFPLTKISKVVFINASYNGMSGSNMIESIDPASDETSYLTCLFEFTEPTEVSVTEEKTNYQRVLGASDIVTPVLQ